jgi:hypothetical protein
MQPADIVVPSGTLRDGLDAYGAKGASSRLS